MRDREPVAYAADEAHAEKSSKVAENASTREAVSRIYMVRITTLTHPHRTIES